MLFLDGSIPLVSLFIPSILRCKRKKFFRDNKVNNTPIYYEVTILIATALISVITANKVIHLTADNFDAVVDGTRNVFAKFEASWCGPCKRMVL